MDLLAFVRSTRRHWILIALCVVVGGAVGVASTQIHGAASPKARVFHKATDTLLFDPSVGTSAFPTAFTNLDQMALLATTGPIPEAVAEKLDGDETGRELAQHITTLTNPTTSTLRITAVDRDGDRAVELADTFAKTLSQTLLDRDQARYAQANKAAKELLDDLSAQVNALAVEIAANPPDVEVKRSQLLALANRNSQAYTDFQEIAATPPPSSALSTLETAEAVPIGESEYDARLAAAQDGTGNLQVGAAAPDLSAAAAASGTDVTDGPVGRAFVGVLLGLLIGVGAALGLDRLDRRLHSREEAEAAFRLPVLAEVPVLDVRHEGTFAVGAYDAPISGTAETFRAVRSALSFHHSVSTAAQTTNGAARLAPDVPGGDDDTLIVMIASASPKEGKTTTTANLAAVFAETGARVLVVNCDFRRPMVHRYLGVPDTPRRVVDTRIPGVKAVTNVLDEHDANPARVLAEQRRLIAAARGQFDVMLLDTAPLLSANDAVDLVGVADLVVLVAMAEQSLANESARATEMLERVHAPVVGVVLLGVAHASSYYYYGYDRAEAARTGEVEPALVGPPRRLRLGRRKAPRVSVSGAALDGTSTNGEPSPGWSTEPRDDT